MAFYPIHAAYAKRAIKTTEAIFQVTGMWSAANGETLLSRPEAVDKATEFNLLSGAQRDRRLITLDDCSILGDSKELFKNPNRAHEFVMTNVYLPKAQSTPYIRDDFETDYLIELSCDEFKQILCNNSLLRKIEECLWFDGDYHENGSKIFHMPLYSICTLGTIKDYNDKLSFEFNW